MLELDNRNNTSLNPNLIERFIEITNFNFHDLGSINICLQCFIPLDENISAFIIYLNETIVQPYHDIIKKRNIVIKLYN